MAIELKKTIKKWISNKAEACKDVSPLFSYALDRELSLIERFRIKFHLLTCNACKSYVTNLGFMREVFHAQEKKLEPVKPSQTLSEDAKDRLKKALESSQ